MDRLVTVFGGGGFLGRYLVRELAKLGARVRIAERDPRSAWSLRTQAALGQTQFVPADITRPATLAAALRGSDSVVNLVGILRGDFQRVHVDGARALAEAAAAAGAEAFVQVSAIGADPQAASAYGRSKGEGEAAVRAAFPSASVIRPSVLFGPEDDFMNRFARMARLMPLLPVIRPDVRMQPAFVADVAKAIARAACDPRSFGGRTFELGGPEVMTMAELTTYAAGHAGYRRTLVPIPDAVGAAIAKLGFLPGAPITQDQWLMLGRDNVVAEGADGFAAFGIAPTPLEAVAPGWLVQYRRHGRFAGTDAA